MRVGDVNGRGRDSERRQGQLKRAATGPRTAMVNSNGDGDSELQRKTTGTVIANGDKERDCHGGGRHWFGSQARAKVDCGYCYGVYSG